jgi:RNA polymerase sigma-70 factor, ECF subfamily
MSQSQQQIDVEELARRAAKGEVGAMDDLLTAIRPRVLRQCQRLLPYARDAEDACQEALLRVAQRIHTFQGRSLFVTWLTQVTANTARDTYQKLKRQAALAGDELIEQVDPRTTSVIAGSRIDLLDALARLDEAHASFVTPFLLRDVYGLSYAEIAEHLELPLGTVKRQIHEARAWMRREF